ncbi:MAG: 50S ribosomal protein L16 [Thermoprotei archaeon]|nr:MAG: 50S ribosomal protein L16 [Thermoprotei archaeon]
MPLRPARCYTHQEKPPYTRKEYIHGVPPPKIVKYVMGNPHIDADTVVVLMALEKAAVRHNALEAARLMASKYLSTTIGDQNFMLIIRTYPHHVIREHKMMAFAGADRLQEGMRLAFGKPVGTAARVDMGTEIIEVRVKSNNIEHAKEALRRAASKLPVKTRIVIKKLAKAS